MLRVIGAALAGLIFAAQAYAADVPTEIKIGTLYASSGRFRLDFDAGIQLAQAVGRS